MEGLSLFDLLKSEADGNLKNAVEALRNGEFQKAITLSKEALSSSDGKQMELASALTGIGSVALKDFQQAVHPFDQARPFSHLGKELRIYLLHFSSYCLTKVGRSDEALKVHFEMHQLEDQLGVKRDFNLHFQFAQAMVEAGKGALLWDEVKDMALVYESFRITQDSFLGLRGLPFFDEYLTVLAGCARNAQKSDELKAVLLRLKKSIDEEGQKLIDRMLSSN